MPEFSFDRDVTSRPDAPDRRLVTVNDEWDTPRGTRNGGYVLAVVVEAMRHSSPFDRILSVSVNYLKPPPLGESVVEAEVVRTGRRTATVVGRMVQDGVISTVVNATFVDRDAMAGGYTHSAPVMPALPPPEKCVDTFASLPRGTIKIADHFDYRHADVPGWLQGSPNGRMESTYWTRFANGREPDELSLMIFPDAYPPVTAEINKLDSATVQLTINVFRKPVPGWLLAHVQTTHVIDNFHDENVELWDSSGHLVAQSRQLAILGS